MRDALASDKQGFSGRHLFRAVCTGIRGGNYCNSLEFFSSLSGATQMKGFASFAVPNCRAALCSAFQSVSVEMMIRTPFLKKELARPINVVWKQKVC